MIILRKYLVIYTLILSIALLVSACSSTTQPDSSVPTEDVSAQEDSPAEDVSASHIFLAIKNLGLQCCTCICLARDAVCSRAVMQDICYAINCMSFPH